jgi:hypothetical protein
VQYIQNPGRPICTELKGTAGQPTGTAREAPGQTTGTVHCTAPGQPTDTVHNGPVNPEVQSIQHQPAGIVYDVHVRGQPTVTVHTVQQPGTCMFCTYIHSCPSTSTKSLIYGGARGNKDFTDVIQQAIGRDKKKILR